MAVYSKLKIRVYFQESRKFSLSLLLILFYSVVFIFANFGDIYPVYNPGLSTNFHQFRAAPYPPLAEPVFVARGCDMKLHHRFSRSAGSLGLIDPSCYKTFGPIQSLIPCNLSLLLSRASSVPISGSVTKWHLIIKVFFTANHKANHIVSMMLFILSDSRCKLGL